MEVIISVSVPVPRQVSASPEVGEGEGGEGGGGSKGGEEGGHGGHPAPLHL